MKRFFKFMFVGNKEYKPFINSFPMVLLICGTVFTLIILAITHSPAMKKHKAHVANTPNHCIKHCEACN